MAFIKLLKAVDVRCVAVAILFEKNKVKSWTDLIHIDAVAFIRLLTAVAVAIPLENNKVKTWIWSDS